MNSLIRVKALIIQSACAFIILLLASSYANAEEEASPAPQQKGLQQRIDFGSAHILGQSIKSGAVYLMHRKKSDIKNMLEVRENYRKEIIEDFSLENTALSEKTIEGPENIKK